MYLAMFHLCPFIFAPACGLLFVGPPAYCADPPLCVIAWVCPSTVSLWYHFGTMV